MKVWKPTEEEIEQTKNWGTWGKESSEFPWTYDDTETCYILDGEAIARSKNGEEIKFSAGDGTTVYSAGYPDVTFDAWAYMVGVVDRSSNYMYTYQDSNLEGSYGISSLGSVDTSESLTLSPSSYVLDGMMDEVAFERMPKDKIFPVSERKKLLTESERRRDSRLRA